MKRVLGPEAGMPAIWRTVLLVSGLWSSAPWAAEPSSPSGPRAGVDQTFVVSTEIGTYALFHPDDLGHHLAAPLRWPWYEFSVSW